MRRHDWKWDGGVGWLLCGQPDRYQGLKIYSRWEGGSEWWGGCLAGERRNQETCYFWGLIWSQISCLNLSFRVSGQKQQRVPFTQRNKHLNLQALQLTCRGYNMLVDTVRTFLQKHCRLLSPQISPLCSYCYTSSMITQHSSAGIVLLLDSTNHNWAMATA